jgi:hypothetical protein
MLYAQRRIHSTERNRKEMEADRGLTAHPLAKVSQRTPLSYLHPQKTIASYHVQLKFVCNILLHLDGNP